MTRNMRNFWVEGSVDGRQTDIATGPRAKDGGIQFDFYQNNNGESEHVLSVRGEGYGDEKSLYVKYNGSTVIVHRTERYKEHKQEALHCYVVGDMKDLLNRILKFSCPLTYRNTLAQFVINNGYMPCELQFDSIRKWYLEYTQGIVIPE